MGLALELTLPTKGLPPSSSPMLTSFTSMLLVGGPTCVSELNASPSASGNDCTSSGCEPNTAPAATGCAYAWTTGTLNAMRAAGSVAASTSPATTTARSVVAICPRAARRAGPNTMVSESVSLVKEPAARAADLWRQASGLSGPPITARIALVRELRCWRVLVKELTACSRLNLVDEELRTQRGR